MAMGPVLRPVVSARTWLAMIYVIAGLVIGLVSFVVAVVGVVLGAALVPLAFVGVPVLATTLAICHLIGRLERARAALMLGAAIQAPGLEPLLGSPWWRPRRAGLLDPSRWREVAAAVVALPVGLVVFVLAAVAWALPVILIPLPAYNRHLPRGGAVIGGSVLAGTPTMVGAVAAGVLLLLLAPRVLGGLAALQIRLLRALLGPSRRRDLTARIGQLERSRSQVIDAAEAERRRIERDLHDGAQQRLVALAMQLGRARARFADDPATAKVLIDEAHEEAKAALTELRNLVRGVHPPVLSDRGLDAALSGLAARCPVPVTVDVDTSKRPAPTVEAVAYFVVAEALTNVAKHAGASRASVTVRHRDGVLSVRVSDDGVGGADPAGAGLSGLAGRVGAVDGRLSIESPRGGPTIITVEMPCES